jgi:hypothetical protein
VPKPEMIEDTVKTVNEAIKEKIQVNLIEEEPPWLDLRCL